MKKTSLLLLVLVTLLGCNKDDDIAEVPDPGMEMLPDARMTFAVQGDTITTDSVYTRSTAYVGYQIGAVAPSGETVLLTIHGFVGTALYIADNQLMNDGVNFYNHVELRDFNGSSFSSAGGTEGGFINITDFSEESGAVSGSFGGVLYDTETGTQTLVIDTGYFEYVVPINLGTLPGKADVFKAGKLYKNLDVDATVNANHQFKIGTMDTPPGGEIAATLNDFTPSVSTSAYFYFNADGGPCHLQRTVPYDEKFHVDIDSASQTATGYLQYELLDIEIIFNQVPIELPEFSAESDLINLLFNNEVVPFEEYAIQYAHIFSSHQTVEVQAWSSTGKYLEVFMLNPYEQGQFGCHYHDFVGTIKLFDDENDPEPSATFPGKGNLTHWWSSATHRNLGFISDEAELSGKDLEVTW